MIKLSIIGTGNVATHLTKAFLKTNQVEIVQVYARKEFSDFFTKKKIDITSNIHTLKEADIYIIAVSDDAIAMLSRQIDAKNSLVVHTSGSVPLHELQNKNSGVFYPLQTFSKNIKVNFKKVPICIEASSEKDHNLLKTLAESISKKVYTINSMQRKSLHVAAVFVNNFVNHLYKIGHDICKEKEVDFSILQPLILETAKKIKTLSPELAQTGPAVRNDQNTIKEHLTLLNSEHQEIYSLLTQSIRKH